jgi:hypothetical protein
MTEGEDRKEAEEKEKKSKQKLKPKLKLGLDRSQPAVDSLRTVSRLAATLSVLTLVVSVSALVLAITLPGTEGPVGPQGVAGPQGPEGLPGSLSVNWYQFTFNNSTQEPITMDIYIEEDAVLEGYVLGPDEYNCLEMRIAPPQEQWPRFYRDWHEGYGLDFSYATNATGTYLLSLTPHCRGSYLFVYWISN